MPDTPSEKRDAHPGPHVLHVVDGDVFLRFGRMLRQLFLALVDADVGLSVLTDDFRSAERYVPPSATLLLWPGLTGWAGWRMVWQLSDRFARPPVMAHVWGMKSSGPVLRWAGHSETSVLVHALSTSDVRALKKRGVRPNQYAAGACRRFCKALTSGGHVSHFPIQCFAPGLLIPDAAPPERGRGHTPGVIRVGPVEPDSGLETLIKAVAQLRDRGRTFQVALIGTGPHEARVRGAIRVRNLQDRISVINDVTLWDNAMRGADVCVVPEREAELSLAPLLAMAMAKPVLAADDQLAEWYIDNQTAWLFKSGAAAELADLLQRVAAEPEAAAALGVRAKAHVTEHHRISRLTADMVEFYTGVAYPQKTVPFRARGAEAAARP